MKQCSVVKNIDFSIQIDTKISEKLPQDTQYQLRVLALSSVWQHTNLYPSTFFGVGLCILRIILLIPTDFVLMTKMHAHKAKYIGYIKQ